MSSKGSRGGSSVGECTLGAGSTRTRNSDRGGPADRATLRRNIKERAFLDDNNTLLPDSFKQAHKPKPISFTNGALIYIGLSCIGMLVSTTIATYVFFGSITLAGLIAIAENNKYIRYVILIGNKLLDLVIFALTIFATISLGVTLTASLTFAGLGYTLIYAPYLRSK